MTLRVYYNEFDKKKCAMLKQLMHDGHITEGDIDDRPIQQVNANELVSYDRCHFFAGIGLWEYSLNLAGWPGNRPVWTGSCPCQPYSTAGRQKAQRDDRHLWPEWLRLIAERRPPTVFGEQVANSIAFGWLDDVYQGLEAEGYAVGAAVLPASAVGAPHRRERLWFVADSDNQHQRPTSTQPKGATNFTRAKQGGSFMADTSSARSQGYWGFEQEPVAQGRERAQRHPWESGVWIDCPDGKQRLVKPGVPLLVNEYSARVPILHAIGDAIVPELAATFITASM